MATNVFFRNYDNFNEQQLIDDLVIESIKMYGVDVMYIRRSLGAVDEILNEDDLPLYDEMFQFEAYVKTLMALKVKAISFLNLVYRYATALHSQ